MQICFLVTRTAVSKWEMGKGLPEIDTLKLISTTFGLSLDELVSDDVIESKKILDKKRARIMYIIARKLIIPYIISRAVILLFVIGLIVYTVVTL